MTLPQGVYVPLITPFKPDEEKLDVGAARANAERLSQSAVAGFMAMGSNGEYHSLGDDEAIALLTAIKMGTRNGKRLLAGVSRESAYATLEMIRSVEQIGIDAVFALTPSYFAKAMDADALLRYYVAVAERSPLPLMLYTAPGFAAGVALPGEVALQLSQHPNVIGMKDTSKQPPSTYADCISPTFQVFAGSQDKLMDWMQAGAAGGVLSSSNFVPDVCCRVLQAVWDGRMDEAQRLDAALRSAGSAISGRFGVAGVKAAATLMGYSGGVARNPLPTLDAEQIQQVEQALRSLEREAQ